jgi:hypothetical protein
MYSTFLKRCFQLPVLCCVQLQGDYRIINWNKIGRSSNHYFKVLSQNLTYEDRGKAERLSGWSVCVPIHEPETLRVRIRYTVFLVPTLDQSPSCFLFTFVDSYSNSPLTAVGQQKLYLKEEYHSNMTERGFVRTVHWLQLLSA